MTLASTAATTGFALDDEPAQRRRDRIRRLELQQIPLLRALGFAAICTVLLVYPAGDAEPPSALIALNAAYVALAWVAGALAQTLTPPRRASLVFFHADLAMWLVNIAWVEHASLFFAFFLLIRVADQVGFGFRRALTFAIEVPLAYLAYGAIIASADPARALWPDRLGVAATLLLLGLYLAAVGLTTERLRRRFQHAVQLARSTAASVAEKAAALQAQALDLEQARGAAETANQAKTQFLAVTSHELRTPMNGIVGATELLAETPLSARQRVYLETVHHSATSLLRLIDDILDLTQIERGSVQLAISDVDLRALLDETVELIRLATRNRTIDVQVILGAAVPAHVRADAQRLRQVLVNLLHNAVKFTDRGRIELAVELVGRQGRDWKLRFSVRDTGIGIAADKLDLVFQAFTQVDGSSTRRHGGSGLGLAIVRELVTLMDGQIGVRSEAGVGSRFWFDLSLRQAAPPEVPLVVDSDGDELIPARVLLVEDDAVNQLVVTGMLEVLGCVVTQAADGQAALDKLLAGDYEIVLMDCHMPVMDGFEATRRIRAAQAGSARHLPIVAVTADSLASDRERCLDCGMDDFMTKPVTRSQLAAVILRWTGRRTHPTTQW